MNIDLTLKLNFFKSSEVDKNKAHLVLIYDILE